MDSLDFTAVQAFCLRPVPLPTEREALGRAGRSSGTSCNRFKTGPGPGSQGAKLLEIPALHVTFLKVDVLIRSSRSVVLNSVKIKTPLLI